MIKNIWKIVKEKAKNNLKLYPVTLIIIILETLFLAFFIDSFFDEEILAKIAVCLFFFGIGTFLGENLFKKKIHKVISYILALIIACLLTYLSFASTNALNTLAFKFGFGYSTIVLLLSFYKLYKNSKDKLGTYLVKTFSGLLKVGVIYSVLSSGLLLICSVFSFLLLGDDGYDLIWRVQILLIGIYYLPGIIDVLSNNKENPFEFLRVLIHYIMEILVLIAFVIIYLYMIKILVTFELPSNQIFRILAILFILSLPVWIMNRHYDDQTIFTKINNNLPIAFIPFIFLEVYSLGIRIISNGLTNIRYFGVMIILFQICYLVIYIFKKEKLDVMFIVTVVLLAITFIVPRYNMIDLSNLSQINRIIKYLEKGNLTDNEKRIVVSSYNYIDGNFNGDSYIKKYLTDYQTKLDEILATTDYYREYKVYNINKTFKDAIDIDGYKTLDTFSQSLYVYTKRNDLKFVIEKSKDKIDLAEFILDYIENYEKEDYVENNHEFIFENCKISLTYININYDEIDREFDNIFIEGYLLER